MRVVALEEHFIVPSLLEAYFDLRTNPGLTPRRKEILTDLDEGRIKDMDDCGITYQVISASIPGADLLDGKEGIHVATETNNTLAAALRRHPDRFGGFAHLPMREPSAAADELERAVVDLGFSGAMVNGLTDNRFLDDPRFDPVLERAAALDVPIYIHPNVPPKAVYDVYYDRLPGPASALLASGAFGWHSETAIHILRLVLTGAFERHPRLTIIAGHMGEMLPFMLGRADDILIGHGGLNRPISETIVDRVYITTSGMFTTPPLLTALTTFGTDRIMFSVDYPFSQNSQGKAFLENMPVSPADRAKIAHGNADRVLKLSQRM
ncbi:amidohydrolase family protein [Paraburkholderia terrae]|uniref:Amidohydrolase n=1 Tax=Paraburkholderia terrae TaxID=311230 RepID=A0A2I8F4W1_9BURK|nr:amidohydrolase family protein [Paraburkholderia terrae]AUT66885.1 amidohydrolase [Paraburkholderia terrae]